MPRYKAIVEYDGTNYCGMQKQKDCNKKTIQGVLEEAISKFANKPIEIGFSGRTDAGVHAIGQVIHFDLPELRDEFKVLYGTNFYLVDEDIAVKNVVKVDDDFHARFSAKKRYYMYRVLNTEVYSPLLNGRVFFYHYNVDIKMMKKVAKMLVGKKMDFSAFCCKESVEKVNTFKTINKIGIKKVDDEIRFYFEAKSFLHNMIRIIVGVLLEVGRGKITINDVKNIIKSKQRSDKCETAPACGLYFLETKY